MTLLNEADAVYRGAVAVDRVYLGVNLVWQPAVGVSAAVAAVAPKPTATAGALVSISVAVAASAPKPTAAAGALVSISAAVAASAAAATAAAAVDVEEAGGGLWTPAEIPTGMVTWLDAADAPQLVFGGSNLTQWKDKSPAANHAVPFVTGPTLTSINSLGSLAFNAQGLHTGTAISLGDFTVFAVFTAGTPGSYERLLDQDFTNGFWLGRNSTFAQWGGGVRNVTDPYGYYVALADGETHQVMTRRGGSTQYVSGNGGAVATSGAVTTTPTSSQWIAIGTGFDNIVSDRLGNDVISEILVWSNSLSADDQAKVEGYLAWKWGIEAKLPVGHPYKSAAPTTGAPAYPAATGGTAPLTRFHEGEYWHMVQFNSVTNPLTLTVTAGGTFEAIAVGGGGGGGFGTASNGGGGGGGGDVYPADGTWASYELVPGPYGFTIGAAGARSTSAGAKGSSGGTTTALNGLISVAGGAGGGSGNAGFEHGAAGASGGGAAGVVGALGGDGNPGGDGGNYVASLGGAGGGGRMANGTNATGTGTGLLGGSGGIGVTVTYGGLNHGYLGAGGGGAGGTLNSSTAGLGGNNPNGGGRGSSSNNAAVAWFDSGGGGGGAGYSKTAGDGASGVVYVRWKVEIHEFPEATGGTITEITDGGLNYYLAEFTTTGGNTFTVTKGGAFECLSIGGGGGGGFGSATICGGGGGGGAIKPATGIWQSTTRGPGNYTMSVATGGAASASTGTKGGGGGTSLMWNSDNVFSAGGGGGGGSSTNVSGAGAVGGGGGGAGNTGGTGGASTGGAFAGGSFNSGTKGCGGGGMTSVGLQGSGTGATGIGGAGGNGIAVTIGGVTTYYGGAGGGGGGGTAPGLGGAGGSGVGGNGGGGGLAASVPVANRGGGGGGGGLSTAPSAGAAGKIMIRWRRP